MDCLAIVVQHQHVPFISDRSGSLVWGWSPVVGEQPEGRMRGSGRSAQ